VKCPKCGKSLYGVPTRARLRKDGTVYPTYYSYARRSNKHYNGIECGYGQISCNIVDTAIAGTISSIMNAENFNEMMTGLIAKQVDTDTAEKELKAAIKAHKQALGLQRKIEDELDTLDVSDRHYDRRYESLNRRLEEAFDAMEEAEQKVADSEARLESIKKQKLTRDSVYESLKIFDKLYNKTNDYEKKKFVNSFIRSIELHPDKTRKNGNPVKVIHFRFPVAYNGESVYDVYQPQKKTDESCVLLEHVSNRKADSYVKLNVKMEDYYRVKDAEGGEADG